MLIIPPFTMFVVVNTMFTFVYSQNQLIVWVTVGGCAGMGFLMLLLPNKRPEGPLFYLQLGLLCVIAVGVGSIVGYFNWHRNMSHYDAYDGQRIYHNVIPSESALAHLDAGKIYFTADAKPDLTKAVGYKGGSRYCVAPIVDSRAHTQKSGEFFAAGVDCCQARGGFTCGASGDYKAHSGLVYLDDDLVAKFRKAAEQTASAFGTVVSKDAIFVDWVKDPNKAGNVLLNSGITFFVMTIVVYLTLSIIAGFWVLVMGIRSRRLGKM